MNSPISKFSSLIIFVSVFAVSASTASAAPEPDSQYQDTYSSESASQQRAELAHHIKLLKSGWRLIWQDNFTGREIRQR